MKIISTGEEISVKTVRTRNRKMVWLLGKAFKMVSDKSIIKLHEIISPVLLQKIDLEMSFEDCLSIVMKNKHRRERILRKKQLEQEELEKEKEVRNGLSLSEQIELLSVLKEQLSLRVEKKNLRSWIYDIAGNWTHEFLTYRYIPLFLYENAKKFKALDGCDMEVYWWNDNPFDYDNRIAFVEWMISELEKQKGVGE